MSNRHKRRTYPSPCKAKLESQIGNKKCLNSHRHTLLCAYNRFSFYFYFYKKIRAFDFCMIYRKCASFLFCELYTKSWSSGNKRMFNLRSMTMQDDLAIWRTTRNIQLRWAIQTYSVLCKHFNMQTERFFSGSVYIH